jgi:membrane fusion protein, type I secretion system
MSKFNWRRPFERLASAVKHFYTLEKDQQPFSPRLITTGIVLTILFLLSFSAWSSLAPIEGAIVSRGIVSVAGFRKQIQHLEGGIVESIHVQDGDKVSKGQLLIQLSDVKPAARLRQYEMQQAEAQAIIARLQAELSNSGEITFPDELIAQVLDPAISELLTGQNNILLSNRALLQDQLSVLNHKIVQTDVLMRGLHDQVKSKQQQHSLIKEELSSFEKALAKKLVAKPTVLRLRHRLAEAEGELSTFQADIGQLEQEKLELRLHISEAKATQIADITDELRKYRAQSFKLSQRIITARDVLQRTQVVSPIDGVVVNLQIHTNDGVIAPGQAVLDVLPTDDELVVYAFIHPDDIDQVRSGMKADISLTSLSRRSRIPLAGQITDVSADRLTDTDTGQEYYRARVEFNPEVIKAEKNNLLAGMGAEVFIRTEARTPLDSLLEPITRSLQLGLREN